MLVASAPSTVAPTATAIPAAWDSDRLLNVDYWYNYQPGSTSYRSTALRVGDDYRLIGSDAPISQREARRATASERFLEVGASFDDAVAAAKTFTTTRGPDKPSSLIGILQAANGSYFLTGLGVWARFRGLLTPSMDSETILNRNAATSDLKALVQTSRFGHTQVFRLGRPDTAAASVQ